MYDGPGDEVTDQIIEGGFALSESGVTRLFEEAATSPLGEREYWRRVLMDHPDGPQMSTADFETVWAGMTTTGRPVQD